MDWRLVLVRQLLIVVRCLRTGCSSVLRDLRAEVGPTRDMCRTRTHVRRSMATTEGGHASTTPGGGPATFADFLRRVCAGDESAATELVERYEPALRLEIQFRLTDPKLRRLLDPADVCQSVLKSFFVRAATGHFELDSQEKLMALLRAMARNKIAHEARKQKAQRRDVRRDVSVGRGSIAGDRPEPEPEPAGDRPGIARCVPLPALGRGAADGRPPLRRSRLDRDRHGAGRYPPGPPEAVVAHRQARYPRSSAWTGRRMKTIDPSPRPAQRAGP